MRGRELHRLGWRRGEFRFWVDTGEEDASGSFRGEQDEAGLAGGKGGVDGGVAGMDFGGAAAEAADHGFGGFVVESDPANHEGIVAQGRKGREWQLGGGGVEGLQSGVHGRSGGVRGGEASRGGRPVL